MRTSKAVVGQPVRLAAWLVINSSQRLLLQFRESNEKQICHFIVGKELIDFQAITSRYVSLLYERLQVVSFGTHDDKLMDFFRSVLYW